jgi:hypothetical protein
MAPSMTVILNEVRNPSGCPYANPMMDSSLALRMTGFGHGRFSKTDSQSAEIEE